MDWIYVTPGQLAEWRSMTHEQLVQECAKLEDGRRACSDEVDDMIEDRLRLSLKARRRSRA